jgi:signal peptidase I
VAESPSEETSEESPIKPKRRWPGVLLSLLVPGFGLVRAGLPYRGIAWFAGMCLAGFVMAAGAALSVVPIWLVVCLWLGAFAVLIWMLCDSFRPGKMTLPLWLLFLGLVAVFAILPAPVHLVARAFKMPTGSMAPTLLGAEGNPVADHLIADRLSYRFTAPKRGDLIVFGASKVPGLANSYPEGREIFYTKRLVGMPGERIRIADGKIYADGRLLGESDGIPPLKYFADIPAPPRVKREGNEFVVGPGEFFVLGDNSPHSNDSRYWGCVPTSAVYGKITMIYYPFSRMRRFVSQ